MGCGKSTLGKKLANKLEVPFVDSDLEIENHFQKSIGELFAEHGESHFREIEREYIDALELRDNFVLATGGGMPCFANNMEQLNKTGTTFYLERSPKELANRLANAKQQRPLIEGLKKDELLGFIESKLSEREEYYKKADIILGRNEQTPEAIMSLLKHLHP
ncbi:MAG: shikimate kinase [Crocinitomicaceae bacterium]